MSAPPVIEPRDITGLVLAGGHGSRMGGTDKGLLSFEGVPLALRALLRLAPQVGSVMISANRNLAAYESMGAAVWPDADGGASGPLGGWRSGLEQCQTPWLVCVPCTAPAFPDDLVARLSRAAAAEDADLALAATDDAGRVLPHPLFALMRATLLEDLERFLSGGGREVERFVTRDRCALVPFGDAQAFATVNTRDDLYRLQR